MSNLSFDLRAVAVSLLVLGANAWSVPTMAQQAASPGDLAAYTAKLEQGRAIESQINGSAKCLEARHDAVFKRSKAAEVRLGELQRKTNDLVAQEVSLRSSNAALMADFQNLRMQQESLFSQRRTLLADLEKERRRYEDCVYAAWFPPAALVCLAVQAIIKEASGKERILQGQIDALNLKINNTSTALQDSRRRLDDAQRALAATQGDLSRAVAERNALESEIVQLKVAIKVLNEESHKHGVLLNEFSQVIADAASVGADTDPQKLARYAQQVDEAIASALTLLQQTNAALPAESQQQCAVQ